MDKEKKQQEELLIQEGIPLDEEKTEEIAEEIQELVENDNPPAAIELISKLHPVDQSEVIEELPQETQQKMLTNLDPEEAADILEHLDPEDAVKATEGMDPAALSDILDEADSDVQADILRQMPKDRSAQVLKDMEEAAEVIPLLQYPDDSAGGRMVLEYVSIKADATAANALDTLRELEPDVQDVRSIYVVDDEGHLVGELSIVRLALVKPQTIVRDIMDMELISVSVETNQEECARVIGRYALDQLPVVDEEKRLVGVIMSTDIIEVIEEEATEDM